MTVWQNKKWMKYLRCLFTDHTPDSLESLFPQPTHQTESCNWSQQSLRLCLMQSFLNSFNQLTSVWLNSYCQLSILVMRSTLLSMWKQLYVFCGSGGALSSVSNYHYNQRSGVWKMGAFSRQGGSNEICYGIALWKM